MLAFAVAAGELRDKAAAAAVEGMKDADRRPLLRTPATGARRHRRRRRRRRK
jgi:hypothetical protein